ncbi:hypothetical protein AB0O01_27180 [Streptomyces sp. NPDC093252]|uniref:hypothetical protein n=1 Tax=Streptomyces sp. NPDC093252 TaxID=3154980 RepID=UPI00341653F9
MPTAGPTTATGSAPATGFAAAAVTGPVTVTVTVQVTPTTVVSVTWTMSVTVAVTVMVIAAMTAVPVIGTLPGTGVRPVGALGRPRPEALPLGPGEILRPGRRPTELGNMPTGLRH